MISAGEFDAWMSPLAPWPAHRRVAVAVSGGADSVCLAWLAKRWGEPLALIIDHGLRTESEDEARVTAERLAGFGVPSRIFRLTLAPGPGIAARARVARYTALRGAARAENLLDILLGHHARDQAETVLLRGEDRSGPAGLAGMASIVEGHDVRLVRPLLHVAPWRLRETLRAAGVGWVEDPSNRNRLAARVRIREALGDEDGTAPGTMQAVRRAAANGVARQLAEQGAARWLAAQVGIFPEAYAVIVPNPPIDAAGLGALIRALSGGDYMPGQLALVRLAGSLERCDFAGATLGGVRFMPAGRLGRGVLAVREAAAVQPPVPASWGIVWDGRFRLSGSGILPSGAVIGPVADAAAGLRGLSLLPDSVLRCLPMLRDASGNAAVPHLGAFFGWTNRTVRLTFMPQNAAAGPIFAVHAGLAGVGDAETLAPHHVLRQNEM